MRLRSEIRHCNILKHYIDNNKGSKNEKIKQIIEMYNYLAKYIDWVKQHPKLYKRCQEKIIEFYFDDVRFYSFFHTFEINLNKLFNYINQNTHSFDTSFDN
jgi:hypothetical protein